MKINVAIWDTYLQKTNGNVMHFDIVVPENIKSLNAILEFGNRYLKSIQQTGILTTKECSFCHVESPTPEMLESISRQGYHIIEMSEIPHSLPALPTRKDLIMHLRGHYSAYRFADFQDKTMEDLLAIIQIAEKSYTPIDCNFHDALLEKATIKKYCKIQYFTEIRELITTQSIIKDIFTQNKVEYMLLATDELIRLDKIVSVDGVVSPNYTYFQDFSCDC